MELGGRESGRKSVLLVLQSASIWRWRRGTSNKRSWTGQEGKSLPSRLRKKCSLAKTLILTRWDPLCTSELSSCQDNRLVFWWTTLILEIYYSSNRKCIYTCLMFILEIQDFSFVYRDTFCINECKTIRQITHKRHKHNFKIFVQPCLKNERKNKWQWF